MADIFDQLASQQPQGQQAAPPKSGGGDVFDQLASGSAPAPQPTASAVSSGETQMSPNDGILTTAAKSLGGALSGIGEGVYGTAADLSDITDKVTGMQRGTVNKTLHTLAGDGETQDAAHNVGRMAEDIGEWFLGDAALKGGISASAKLNEASKLVAFVEKYPRLASVLHSAITGGVVGAAEGGIHTESGSGALTGGVLGLAGGAAGGALGAGLEAVQGNRAVNAAVEDNLDSWTRQNPIERKLEKTAIKSGLPEGHQALDELGVATQQGEAQGAYHADIRDIAQQAVKDTVPDAQVAQPKSMRDVMGTSARAVLDKAKGNYGLLDEASNGDFNKYRDQLQKINNQLDGLIEGVDDDRIGQLEARKSAVEDAQNQMFDRIKAEGKIDPAIVDDTRALYRKGMALQDVNKAMQMATERIPRPGVGATEEVNPTKLSNRLQKLNDVPLDGGPSRLEQALGKDGAQRLITRTDAAAIQTDPASFVPTTSTGRFALKEILRDHTTQSGIDWKGAAQEFHQMGAQKQLQMFHDDLPKVQKVINTGAKWQGFREKAPGAALKLGAAAMGLDYFGGKFMSLLGMK